MTLAVTKPMQKLRHEDIVSRLVGVVGEENLPAQLHVPEIGPSAWTYIKDCLDTNWVSSVGTYVGRFEEMVAEFTGARYAVATVNGTAALHIALLMSGVDYGSEVIMPSLTFIATANAVSYLGARPHFVDINDRDLGIDNERLADYLREIVELRANVPVNRLNGKKISALVGMHAFGHPFEVVELRSLCEEYRIPFVEDAAEGLGSTYHGTHVGNFARLSVLSFNGNKTITTGGGGIILTSDDGLAKQAKHLTTTGKRPHPWEFFHDMVAYNYRLPNLNSALGCSQMEDLPRLLAAKRVLADDYIRAFDGTDIRVLAEPPGCRSNFWLNAIILPTGGIPDRDALLQLLHQRGLMCRPVWKPMHELPMYTDCQRMPDLSVTGRISERLINLPSSSILRRNRSTDQNA